MSVRISTARDEMNMHWVISTLRASYWGGHLRPIDIMRACDNSLCFSAYSDLHGEQIGLLRVITDHACVSSITDMIVDEKERGRGVGRALLETALAHPWVKPTICVLASRDARGLYAKFGFRCIGGDVMTRDPQ